VTEVRSGGIEQPDRSPIELELDHVAGVSSRLKFPPSIERRPVMLDSTGIFLIAVALAGAWNVFAKAGRPGWEAIVPLYNVYVLTVITAQPWWVFVLCLIPFVNLLAMGFLYLKLAERFGQTWPYAVGLLFLPFVFFPLLGFGQARYSAPSRPG
jgi:hypothetical protein